MNAIEFYFNNVYSHFKTIEQINDAKIKNNDLIEMFDKGKPNEIKNYFDSLTNKNWKVKFIKY